MKRLENKIRGIRRGACERISEIDIVLGDRGVFSVVGDFTRNVFFNWPTFYVTSVKSFYIIGMWNDIVYKRIFVYASSPVWAVAEQWQCLYYYRDYGFIQHLGEEKFTGATTS